MIKFITWLADFLIFPSLFLGMGINVLTVISMWLSRWEILTPNWTVNMMMNSFTIGWLLIGLSFLSNYIDETLLLFYRRK